jgi:hypothetical protein
VLVDGAPPQWPLELALEPDVPPPSTRAGVRRKRLHPEQLTLVPEDRGAFAFDGLAPDWSGRLRVRDHTFANGESALRIGAPAADLLLQVHSGPSLVGRIVDPQGRAVALLEGGVELRFRTDARAGGIAPASEIRSRSFACRADGCFRIPCGASLETCSASIVIEDEAHGYLRHETASFSPMAGYDAGELALEPLRRVAFTVRDPSGAPIEGAFARVDGLSFRKVAPLSGADGSGVLELAPDRSVDLRFAAFAHADRVVRAEPGNALDVVLEPLAVLDVRLLGSIAGQADRVVVRAPRAAFVWDESGWDESSRFQLELGKLALAARHTASAADPRFEYAFTPVREDHIALVGLVPDAMVTLEVLDPIGRSLAFESLSVGRGERASLELGEASLPRDPPANARRRRSP